MIRENNQAANKTWVWTYDDAGNILSKKEYAYTTDTLGSELSTVNYTYGDSAWGDLLTEYGGRTITHDEIGNPLSDGVWTYTWEHGRELATMSNGSTTWTNTYNADGLRTQRTNGSTTYNYIYNGGSLSQMTVGSNTLYFAYDVSGTPMSVTYNGTAYYYATNLQGDVTAILNTSGTAVVQYTYDAWGSPLSVTGTMAETLGVVNPLRYRGYVYDTETQFYYLQSRYYDPEQGRFINADAYASTGQGVLGNNMFAYCLNNPVISADYTGFDAVILYKESGVGHIGFLVQDKDGKWWHFYWGADGLGKAIISAFNVDVQEKTWLKEYTGNPFSLAEINGSGQYGGTYTNKHYLVGDFSDVLDAIYNLSEDYNLHDNNCGQVSMRLLAEANTPYREMLREASELWTPKEIDAYIRANIDNCSPIRLDPPSDVCQFTVCL